MTRGDDAPSSRRRSSDPQLGPPRFSRGPWSPAEQQDLCEQVGMHTRPATYVEGPAFFTRGPFGVIDARRQREEGHQSYSGLI